jgi:succinate dehydrogenase/fumarate reductase cytochrome b subunit
MITFVKFFLFFLAVVLLFSAIFGIIAFFRDLRDFKSEKNMSLSRKKLIEALLDEQELKKDGEKNAI